MTVPAGRAPAPSPEAERLEQIARLSQRGDARALMPLLDDPNWATRRAVVAALAANGAASLEPLCAALRDARDSEGRIAAVVDALSAATGDPLPAAGRHDRPTRTWRCWPTSRRSWGGGAASRRCRPSPR